MAHPSRITDACIRARRMGFDIVKRNTGVVTQRTFPAVLLAKRRSPVGHIEGDTTYPLDPSVIAAREKP